MCRGFLMLLLPPLYGVLYLAIERNLSQYALVQYMRKVFTVLAGIFLIVFACTTTFDFSVYLPARGGGSGIPTSIFLAIAGIALMTLPLYSRYIKISNRS